MSFEFIDSTQSLSSLLETIGKLSPRPPSLYIDLEGVHLSRHGTIAILQLLTMPTRKVYIIDVHVLQKAAFDTQSSTGLTLKAILESDAVPKVFFDVRNDSDALFAHFQINLRCVQDIQVMEFATRRVPGKFLKGLASCIEEDGGLTRTNLQSWRSAKDTGCKLFLPDKGGSYAVFLERPLSDQILKYCVQDVTLLPNLWKVYSARLTSTWSSRVEDECQARVKLSQSATFVGDGRHMAIGPWLPTERCSTTRWQPKNDAGPSSMVQKDRSSISLTIASATLKDEEPSETREERHDVGSILDLSSLSISNTTKNLSLSTFHNDLFDELDHDRFGEDLFDESDHDFLDWDDGQADYTACSADDCGYCGKCDY